MRRPFAQIVYLFGWSKNNRYDRFSVLTGQKPVEEFVKTGMPDFVVCTYNIVMMTAFMEQMNDLNTIMVEHLETYWKILEKNLVVSGCISFASMCKDEFCFFSFSLVIEKF